MKISIEVEFAYPYLNPWLNRMSAGINIFTTDVLLVVQFGSISVCRLQVPKRWTRAVHM